MLPHDSEPLVLLAGMNCTSDLWSGCGFGHALTPELAEDSIDAQVDRLLDELPPRFILCGLSLGGIVGMAMITRAPERIVGLCLVSTSAKAPTAAQGESWRRWIERIDGGASSRELQAEIIDVLLSPQLVQHRPDVVERVLAMGEITGAAALRSQLLMQTTRTDLRPGIRSVRVPTLIVSGTADVMCTPQFHTEIAEQIGCADLLSLDGGHLLPIEKPEAFGSVFRAWRTRW